MAGEITQKVNPPHPKGGTLRVDNVYSQKDHQWHFVKSSYRSKKGKFAKYTLVAQRNINLIHGNPGRTSVQVNSPNLAKLFREVLNGTWCEGVNKVPPTFDSDILFHTRPYLSLKLSQEEAREIPDAQVVDDIKEVITFVDDFYGRDTLSIESLHRNGEITYDHLWTLFPPGCFIIQQSGILGEPQALKFSSGRYVEQRHGEQKFYAINATLINYDGDCLGWGEVQLEIPSFNETKAIAALPTLPLKFHPNESQLRDNLMSRGKKYLEFLGMACKEHDGMGVEMVFEVEKWVEKKFYAKGRIMVDPAAYKMKLPNCELLKPKVFNTIQPDDVPEEDLVFCNHRVLGFSFAEKKWGSFAVSMIGDVMWDAAASDRLILSEKRRRLISDLMRGHESKETGFDDIVRGKGKSLVGLLSGAPGTGKTLTAEVVAELSKRPLYVVSAGELGIEVRDLDKALNDMMSMVHRWGCVLLIDEAEIFLRKRQDGQIHQNALVGVFLRRLEYFRGIIILTTNRQQDIDDAFKSRIHFKFHYSPLNESGRLAVWKNFLPEIPVADLRSIAHFEINGREIKNTVSLATTIARAREESLTVETLRDILDNFTSWEENGD
ncbi:hypothetical protein M434DRAFT_28774 [Hypoxylon sp. CO27-5]|nr:hypothetical protein M434DRAFT_28774 [Hypoxylon sp. CO27-5]